MQTAFAQRLSLCRLQRAGLHTVFRHARPTPLPTPGRPTFTSKMSSYSFTLEDLKASEWGEHPMADIAFGMKDSGFHRWGFAIYRTSYGDDAAWDRYLEVLRQSAQKYLERTGGDVLLEQYMDWLVISDPVGLNGASKAEVRRHFRDWCASRSEERDGAGATRDSVSRLPRFKHCLYVDHKCLDTLANLPANYSELQSRRKRVRSNVVVVVLDGAFEEGATGDSGQGLVPEVEGCSEWYVGWRYEPLDSVITTYKESHEYGLDHQAYRRPPLISPSGRESMPT